MNKFPTKIMDGKRLKFINNKKKTQPISRNINQGNLFLESINLQMSFYHRF